MIKINKETLEILKNKIFLKGILTGIIYFIFLSNEVTNVIDKIGIIFQSFFLFLNQISFFFTFVSTYLLCLCIIYFIFTFLMEEKKENEKLDKLTIVFIALFSFLLLSLFYKIKIDFIIQFLFTFLFKIFINFMFIFKHIFSIVIAFVLVKLIIDYIKS